MQIDRKNIQDKIQLLSKALLEAGIQQDDLQTSLIIVERIITNEMSSELVDSLTEEQKKELDTLQERDAPPTDALSLFGLSEDDYTTKYMQRLNQYIVNLPKHIAQIKGIIQTVNLAKHVSK